MEIKVKLLAFGSNDERIVTIPDNSKNILEAVFTYGQNDFQPQPKRSVSVGDVICLDTGEYKIEAIGFTKITMTKHLLTKEQRDAGLDTHEDDHTIIITDTTTGKPAAILSAGGATVKSIQHAANDYLIEKARRHNGNNQT